MKTIRTDLLQKDSIKSETEKLWVYNGLDCCVTLEVLEATLGQLDNLTGGVYNLSRSLQAPVLEMNMRGVLIDERARRAALASYGADVERLERQLARLVRDGAGYTDFRDAGRVRAWRSNNMVAVLLYDVLRLPEVRKRGSRGELVRTVGREALEKLGGHFIARPIVSHLLTLRDIGKKVSVLETEVDPDGRIRTSYNIAGTTTGRFSSSLNDFGTGGNLQNIEERLRRVFIADPGMKFGNIDLEQADARNIGALCWNVFRDSKYLDVCESGDTHTGVARLAYPALGWTGDRTADRALAERPFYRHHSLRHMCKVLGHGTNYMGSSGEMARHTKIEKEAIDVFQEVYFRTFPAIKKLPEWIQKELLETGHLVTPFGRKRWFFGRRDDKDTLKQAVAFMGQSMTADEMNLAMLRAWRLGTVQLLLQGHDSLLIQYPGERENEIIPQVLEAMRVPLELDGGRQFCVPVECKVGWNWGNRAADNPDGLTKYPDDRRARGT